MIGTIFHWGIYSVPAFDSIKSALRRRTGNGSEWYLARLEEKATWRPLAGYKDVQDFHAKFYGDMKYEGFADLFIPKDVNFDKWMELSKQIGAEYVFLTAMHHDGYCLWDTKTTDHNSVKTGPKMDLLQKFRESAKKHNLKFGVYYSLFTFGKGVTKEYLQKTLEPQMLELLEYQPDYLWLDGNWNVKTKIAIETVVKSVQKFKEIGTLVNDRICGDQKINSEISDYRVFGDRYIPDQKLDIKWQSIQTIGLSWGYNGDQRPENYKSGQELLELYTVIKERGGDLLLNFGPMSNGELDANEVKSAVEFRELLKK